MTDKVATANDADLTAPSQTSQRMPSGIPYIVGNEAAERFSFYGMKAVLFIYLTRYLVNATGHPDPMTVADARSTIHLFVASAYFFPMAGAILSDWLLGKYRTIFWLSLLYCLGHLALAAIPGRVGLLAGLTLIAIGAGGIKPCVSAHVGDQFSDQNKYLLPRVYSWFYFSINLGAFVSTIITPILLDRFGPHWGPHFAFGLPGVLMLLATFVFWLGRKKFVHVRPGGYEFIREIFSVDGLRALSGLIPLYLFVAVFWALYDQTASAWVEQSESMDRRWLGYDWLPSQIQAVNPILVLLLIPICTYLVYPALNRIVRLTSLRKVAIGFVITVLAFGISAGIEAQITGGRLVRNAAVSDDDKLHELIVELREHQPWEISSVGFLLAEATNQSAESTPASAGRVAVKVEVGPAPKGPWHEAGSRDAVELDFDPIQVSFAKPESAAYVRITLAPQGGENAGSDLEKIVDWNSVVVNVIAADKSPPADAHAHATEVWPDVAAVGFRPNIVWQLLAYLVLTLAEVMVSITCLEFSYTQAPKKMKSFVMSLYMLSVSLGNLLTALVNYLIQNSDGTSKLPGANYYWFFTALMLAASVGFLVVVATFREKSYMQSAADAE